MRPRGSPAVPPGGQDARWVGVVADSVEPESPVGWLSRHNAAGTTQLLTEGPWVGYVSRQMAAHETPAARVGYVFRQMAAHDTPAARVGYVFRHLAAHGLQLALHQGRPQRLPPPARRPQAAQSGSLTPDELTSTTTSAGAGEPGPPCAGSARSGRGRSRRARGRSPRAGRPPGSRGTTTIRGRSPRPARACRPA